MEVRVKNLTKQFGKTTAVNHIDVVFKDGKLTGLLGPSGCGKSTTLYMIAGLEGVTDGEIMFGDRDVTTLMPEKRNIGLVFQNYALYPHMTVRDNITFPLSNIKDPETGRPYSRAKRNAATDEIAKLVQIESLLDRKPGQLSGGQQQRVAIARALANEPKVLLLDEPLSALDLKLRKDMQNELKKIQQAIGITFIFVTHDQEEALSMSDTVVVMDKGEIQQIGSPIDIYNEPKNAFVADFIGESNILDGTMIEDYLVEVAGQRFKSLDSGFGKMAPVDVVIRPEDIDIVPTGSAAAHINGVVTSVTFKGVHYEIIVDVDGFKWMIQTTDSANVGDKIGLALTPDDIHVMAKSVYSGTMGDYSTFSDEMEEALQEEGSEHED